MSDSPVRTEPVDGEDSGRVSVDVRVGTKRKRIVEDEHGHFIKNNELVAQLMADVAVMKSMLSFATKHGDYNTKYVTENASTYYDRAEDHVRELLVRLA